MAVKALTGTKESQRDMDGYVNSQRLHDNCCVPANTQARDKELLFISSFFFSLLFFYYLFLQSLDGT